MNPEKFELPISEGMRWLGEYAKNAKVRIVRRTQTSDVYEVSHHDDITKVDPVVLYLTKDPN